MPASRSSLAQLRFGSLEPVNRADPAAVAGLAGRGCRAVLAMPREEGLALLESLGLGRPEFGAISARELAPRCRRGLWDVYDQSGREPNEPNDVAPLLRAHTRALLALAEAAGEKLVMFG